VNEDDVIRRVLGMQTWAVVGCSPDPARDSHDIAALLVSLGRAVIPINPACESLLDRRCYPNLGAVPAEAGVEVVDIFRRSDLAGTHVDEAIAIGAKAVWLQLGVIDHEAAARAAAAGLDVVMDRCPRIEHHRIAGTT
jgi:predicted CoA-binding protein